MTVALGYSKLGSSVCRSCLVRRNYASAAAPTDASPSGSSPFIATPELPSASPSADLKSIYTINAGVVLSRPPQITRDLTPFEKAYYFYQRRLNERLALPFTRYFYFKRGTPADEDWKHKYKHRQTASRDIGKYSAYSKEAWNDELLVGAVESEPEHQIEMLIRDSEAPIATAQEGAKKEKDDTLRPHPRSTEADKTGDQRSLSRLLQRTLYLLVQSNEGYWKFPSSPVEGRESLRIVSPILATSSVNENDRPRCYKSKTPTYDSPGLGC